MSNFSEFERQKMLERIKRKSEEDDKAANELWEQKYESLSLTEKKQIWLRKFWQEIRWQGESTMDEFSIFNFGNYQKWKEKDKEFDAIIWYVAEELDKIHAGDGSIRDNILDRIKNHSS